MKAVDGVATAGVLRCVQLETVERRHRASHRATENSWACARPFQFIRMRKFGAMRRSPLASYAMPNAVARRMGLIDLSKLKRVGTLCPCKFKG